MIQSLKASHSGVRCRCGLTAVTAGRYYLNCVISGLSSLAGLISRTSACDILLIAQRQQLLPLQEQVLSLKEAPTHMLLSGTYCEKDLSSFLGWLLSSEL